MSQASPKRPPAREPIPVLRPKLPVAAKLLPYLERIDANRIYSNWGPLVNELSERLCKKFTIPSGSVVCANSGMSALVGAILAAAGPASAKRPLAIVPDFTFTATGLAVQQCGYQVVIADCRADTWTFTPEDLLAHPDLLKQVGLVVPVAPFGRPFKQAPWHRFQKRTGIPVVIDAAASFESILAQPKQHLGPIPIVLSFHATKSFATGEGGCVIMTDEVLAGKVEQCLNFGFFGSRNSEVRGINGKMSEYAAAVGLAELDRWNQKHRRMSRIFNNYERAFAQREIQSRLWASPNVASCYILLQCDSKVQAEVVKGALLSVGIDTRFWYGDGLGTQNAFKDSLRLGVAAPRLVVPKTLLGLPVPLDLTGTQVQRICTIISAFTR